MIGISAMSAASLSAGPLPGGGPVAAESGSAAESAASTAASGPAKAAAARNLIAGMRIVTGSPREERIVFSLDGVQAPNIFLIEGDPVRLVCDFPGARIVDAMPREIEPRGKLIQRVRTGVHQAPEQKVRVVVELAPGRDYEIDEYFRPKESIYELFIRPAGGVEPSGNS